MINYVYTIFRLNIIKLLISNSIILENLWTWLLYVHIEIRTIYIRLDLFVPGCFTEIIGHEKFTITTLYFFLRRILFITDDY